MNNADKKTLGTFIKVLIVAAVVIVAAFYGSKAFGQDYPAGELTITLSYGPAVNEQMSEDHGVDWEKDYMKPRIREMWKNEKSQAKERFQARRSAVFNFDDAVGLDNADKKVLRDLYDKHVTEKARLDSLAKAEAEKEIGFLDLRRFAPAIPGARVCPDRAVAWREPIGRGA